MFEQFSSINVLRTKQNEPHDCSSIKNVTLDQEKNHIKNSLADVFTWFEETGL